MSEMVARPKKYSTLLALILAGESIFFLPFVLPRIFRPSLLREFDITNLELGACFSTYGIVAMVSYFFGGFLADRFSARGLMTTALFATALGGVAMATTPNQTVLLIIYGYWGFTTIFLFWAAMIKATRAWGDPQTQGSAFGWLEGGRGLTAALLGVITLSLLAWLVGGATELPAGSFQWVILAAVGAVSLAGVVVWTVIPTWESTDSVGNWPTLKGIGSLVGKPAVWMQAIIIICAYVGYKITDDFSLFAHEIVGLSEVEAAGVGTAALWLRPLFAVMAGYAADRWQGTRVISWCFGAMLLGGSLIFLGMAQSILWQFLLLMTTTVVGVYGIRGIYFAVMEDANIPLVTTGTAVGIMSLVGYTPDVFMSPLMGWLLDNHPGATGHQYVFGVLAAFAAVGLVTSLIFRSWVRRKARSLS